MFKRKIHESFDDFLKRNFQESQRKADMIPAVNTQENKFDFIKDLYYRMIKCGKYDSEGLKQEAVVMLRISKEQLESELNEFKSGGKND